MHLIFHLLAWTIDKCWCSEVGMQDASYSQFTCECYCMTLKKSLLARESLHFIVNFEFNCTVYRLCIWKLMQIICRQSKLCQLCINLQCNIISQIHSSVYFTIAYMGNVLSQVWLKSIKKWLSYLTNRWIKTSVVQASSHKPMNKMRWKWNQETRKKRLINKMVYERKRILITKRWKRFQQT